MQWDILAGPLIGAVIGYVTNKIAVDMLFKPLNPIYIGKFHVPFTPGIIPKGKERLGKAIGNAVGNNLLTPTSIKETLLSNEMKTDMANQLDILFQNLATDNTTVNSKIESALGETISSNLETKVVQVLSLKISNGLNPMNLGDIVAAEVMAAVQSKVQGTMFAMFINQSTLAPIKDEIKIRVNQYIEDHGEEKITGFIQEEYTSLKDQSVSSFVQNVNMDQLKQVILNLYDVLVNNYSDKFVSSLNLSKIVEEKISAMDTKEVEKLVLSIMEKELGAIVNLGAVIGFVLGLVNIFFS